VQPVRPFYPQADKQHRRDKEASMSMSSDREDADRSRGEAVSDHDGWSPAADAADALEAPSSGLGPDGWRRADTALRDRILEHLFEDRIFDARRVEVHVEAGVVTLAGRVIHASDIKLAEMLVLEVGPQAPVRNRLRLADAT
jgi:osmotically-inducible protein OsmY